MALASQIWNSLRRSAADEAENQNEIKAQKAQKERDAALAAAKAAVEAQKLDADEQKRMRELRPARDAAHMHIFEKALNRYKNDLAKGKRESEGFEAKVKELITILKSSDRFLSVSYNDYTNQESRLKHLSENPELVLHGNEELTRDERLAHKAAGVDVLCGTYAECMHAHDVEPQLKRLLPPAQYSIVIDHYNKNTPPTVLKITMASVGKDKPSISFRDGVNAEYDFVKPLTAKNLDACLETLAKWQVRRAPETLPALESNMQAREIRTEKVEHHMSVYGHTNFLPNDDDDTNVLKAKLEAHFAAAMPRLREVTNQLYDLLPRPQNKDYFNMLAREVKGLNGLRISGDRTLNVTIDRKNDSHFNLLIESNYIDPSFSQVPDRLEIRWSAAIDRFDALVTGANETKAIQGPQEYRHDAQYQFVNRQIGEWLKAQDADAFSAFVAANAPKRAIFDKPAAHRIAGYKTPKYTG